MLKSVAFLWLLLLCKGSPSSSWNCTSVSVASPLPYVKMNCTGAPGPGSGDWSVGPLLFHVVQVDLAKYKLRGAASSALQTLPEMAKTLPFALGGINGGYFWRVDSDSFIDDVCFFKTRYDAQQPVSLDEPDYGVGDCLLKVDGKVISSNCDLPGYDAPAVLTMASTNSSIFLMERGGRLGPEYPDAIAAGPLLVDYVNGESVYGIPWWDTNVNRWAHSSNTAIGLLGVPGAYHTLVMVVTDGSDSCSRWDQTCGIEAEPMAYFMKDKIGAAVAMEMDQGGSSTLWLSGLGVVNNNRNSPRNIYNALFVTSN